MNDKPLIKLNTSKGVKELFNIVPSDCVVISKQYKGDWVGNYDRDVWLICKDRNNKVIKIIQENDLPFKLDWSEVDLDDRYKMTLILRRG